MEMLYNNVVQFGMKLGIFPGHTLYFIFKIEIMKPGLVYH